MSNNFVQMRSCTDMPLLRLKEINSSHCSPRKDLRSDENRCFFQLSKQGISTTGPGTFPKECHGASTMSSQRVCLRCAHVKYEFTGINTDFVPIRTRYFLLQQSCAKLLESKKLLRYQLNFIFFGMTLY